MYDIVSWPTIVKGDPKSSFSIATTMWCKGGRYSFPWILPFTPDPYFKIFSIMQGVIKYNFLSFCMTRPGIEPQDQGLLANILTKLDIIT